MAPYRRTPYVPSRDPLSAIPPSRHPFQFWVMFACAVTGIANLVSQDQSPINRLLPVWSVVAWAVTLMGSGVLAIVAAWWHDRVTGLLMERAALTSIAMAFLVWGIALLQMIGLAALMGSTLTAVSICIACGWRVVHVNRELRILRSFIEKAHLQ